MDDMNEPRPVPTPDPLSGAGSPALREVADALAVERIDDEVVLSLVEERLSLSKRRFVAGSVRVATRTEVREDVAEVEHERTRVEVTRVPVDRVVDIAPEARAEGDTTIIPIMEERLVVVKQLVLKEELHIRHVVDRELVREPVTLRRQHATVERSTADRVPD